MSSWTSNAREARKISFRVRDRKKRFQKWREKHGEPTPAQDEEEIAKWLKENEITICPPFGHNDPWGNSTTNKRSRGPLLVAGRRVPPRKVRQENN